MPAKIKVGSRPPPCSDRKQIHRCTRIISPPGFLAWSACSDHSVARASWSRMVPARKDRQHPEIFHRSMPVLKRWDHQPPDQDCRSLGLAFPPSFNRRLLSVGSPLIRFPGPHHPNPRWEGQVGVKMAGGSPGCWPVTVNLRGPSDVRRKRSHLAAPIMHGSPGAWQLGPASTNPPWITRVFSVILSFLRKSPRLTQRTLVGSLRP